MGSDGKRTTTTTDSPSQQSTEQPERTTKRVKLDGINRALLDEIPTSSHYHVSFMHRATVTHVISSARHGYVLTACEEGIVKFWKRISPEPPEEPNTSNQSHQQQHKQQQQQSTNNPCLEFVKSFTAHLGPVLSLCIDVEDDTAASIGKDGLIKLYDISTFDATAMVKTKEAFGQAACFLQDSAKDSLLAISSESNGTIFVYSTSTLQQVQTLSLHSKPVTCLAYNPKHQCCVSADEQGILEVWDCTMGTKKGEIVGAPCSMANNGFAYESKTSTDLYKLAKKNTFAVSMSMSKNYFMVYTAEHKVLVFRLATGKIVVRYDERLDVYASNSGANYGMDSIEFGKRAATERELDDHSSNLPYSQLVAMDPSEQYLFVSTLVGIKVIHWQKNKVLKVIGKADASQLRFLSFCLALGDAKTNQQMQLARGGNTSIAMGDQKEKKVMNDALIVALAYNQRRFYVFSHVDPLKESSENTATSHVEQYSRDVWNEPPTAQDQLLASNGNAVGGAGKEKSFSKAILRTTMGDIHIKLFPEVPKTLENFCGHAQSGYYDNVIFHRVIQGFMLQTGDPLGDGTGGESIWGGEFEDEFVRELKHDRPFTVSMANAGPNTNGSQLPTPWLDNKHTVFGRVTKGMDICTLIENVKTDKMDKPLEEVRILSVDVE